METIFTIFGTALSIFLLLHLLEYFLSLLESPDYIKIKYSRSKLGRVPAFVGSLILVYFGVKYGFAYFIPESWGRVNEDNEFVTLRSLIASCVTFIFASLVMFKFELAENKLYRMGLIFEEKKEEEELWKKYKEQFMEYFETLSDFQKEQVLFEKLAALRLIKDNQTQINKQEKEKEEQELSEKYGEQFIRELGYLNENQRDNALNNRVPLLRKIQREEKLINHYSDFEEELDDELHEYKNKYGIEALSNLKPDVIIEKFDWDDADGDQEEKDFYEWLEIKIRRYAKSHN